MHREKEELILEINLVRLDPRDCLEIVSGRVDLVAKIVGGGSFGRGIRPTRLLLCVVHDRAEDVDVEQTGTPGGRELEPENEDGLECVVPREVVKDHSQSEALEEGKEAEDDPIGEPLDIILMLGRLDSPDRKIGRECPADKVGNGSGKCVDKDQKTHKADCASHEHRLGNLGALLEVKEYRVSRQLFIELTVVIFRLCRRLLVHRMVLDVLSSRHRGIAFLIFKKIVFSSKLLWLKS
jgi:hypothetical protein